MTLILWRYNNPCNYTEIREVFLNLDTLVNPTSRKQKLQLLHEMIMKVKWPLKDGEEEVSK